MLLKRISIKTLPFIISEFGLSCKFVVKHSAMCTNRYFFDIVLLRISADAECCTISDKACCSGGVALESYLKLRLET